MSAILYSSLAERLSFDCPATLLQRLAERYSEPHRHYHTWAHVLACVDARDRLTEAAMPHVDLALLFHDAVYVPLAADNEARSAVLLLEEGRRAWLDERLLMRAMPLVEATRHDDASMPDLEEACIVVDADLSVLGGSPAVFDEYERQVRSEYAMVDDVAYAAGRRRVLESFLARPSIYSTRAGKRQWEASARRNLEKSLARLGDSSI